jgi:hypothetical protein
MAITDKLKLAAYLDEAGEDPISACSVLNKAGISYVVLRYAWSGNVCDVSDQACQRLKQALSDNNLSVVTVISDLGKVEPKLLSHIPQEQIDRVFNVVSYFKAGSVRVLTGTRTREPSDDSIRQWMQLITDRCLQANIVPLMEITEDAAIFQASDVAQWLAKFRRWRLLYDPVQLIIRQNQDPFLRYWTLLKSFAAAIDLRDFKIGHGYKPPGFGDAKVKLTLDDTIKSNFKGWYFIEPSLGRRFGGATTKQETFNMALEALEVLLA